jgi:hypothetical protein
MISLFRNRASLYAMILLAVIGLQAEPAYSAKPKVDPDIATPSNPAPWAGNHLSGQKCKNPRMAPGGGPFDFREPRWAGKLNLVEVAHFSEDVENLRRGKTGSLMADLDFVLRAFPNHHRALTSVVNYHLKVRRWNNSMDGQPAECYLQRAMAFRPDDPVLYRMYGYYMHESNRPNLALNANLVALKYWPDDVMLHYNTGLLLFKAKRYEDAEALARPLYNSGLDLPGLKNKLRAKGYLRTPEELAAKKAKQDALQEKIRKMKEAANAPFDPNNPSANTLNDPNNPVDISPEDEKLANYLAALKRKEDARKEKLAKYLKAISAKEGSKKNLTKKPAHKSENYKANLMKLAAAKKARDKKAGTENSRNQSTIENTVAAQGKNAPQKQGASKEDLLKLAKAMKAKEEKAEKEKSSAENTNGNNIAAVENEPPQKPETAKEDLQKLATAPKKQLAKTGAKNSGDSKSKKAPEKTPPENPDSYKDILLQLAAAQEANVEKALQNKAFEAKLKAAPKNMASQTPAARKEDLLKLAKAQKAKQEKEAQEGSGSEEAKKAQPQGQTPIEPNTDQATGAPAKTASKDA